MRWFGDSVMQLHSLKNQLKIAEKENQDLHTNIAREVIKRREAETEELEWKVRCDDLSM